MTHIPSDIAAASAPAGYQAREVAKEREAARAGQLQAAARQVKSVGDAGTMVDTDNADVEIFTDAEGAGSQGRTLEEPTPGNEEAEPPASGTGVTRDSDGRVHLDLQA